MTTSRQPNVLFVFADQMRGMDLHCAGNPDVITPNLDRFAAEGTRFSRAFASVPVCTPSRAVMLTGRYPLANRVIGNDLPLSDDMPTIGEWFRDSGYRTGYIGKWHLDGVPRGRFTPPGSRRHGFDHWAAYNCSHDYVRPEKWYRDDPAPVIIEGYEPEAQTTEALDFLATQDERPFCLVVSWGPPHDPYPMVPERYRERYDPQTLTLRPNVRPLRPATENLARGLEPRRTLADYYAAITALDEQFERLLDGLEAAGQAEHTIVVFTSDHGDQLWSHGTMKKQQPFEESIHIPLICRWPGRIPAGRPQGRRRRGVSSRAERLEPRLVGCDQCQMLKGAGHKAESLAPARRGGCCYMVRVFKKANEEASRIEEAWRPWTGLAPTLPTSGMPSTP
ncbi:MAG: sulfatase [Chloroflexota bacterium]|nr:sulfatase [Chloroflexota bacterium]